MNQSMMQHFVSLQLYYLLSTVASTVLSLVVVYWKLNTFDFRKVIQRVFSFFTTPSTLLVPSKGNRSIEIIVHIYPYSPCFKSFCNTHCCCDILGTNASSQAIMRCICTMNCFFNSVELKQKDCFRTMAICKMTFHEYISIVPSSAASLDRRSLPLQPSYHQSLQRRL
mgnify:CR=1 FL=1